MGHTALQLRNQDQTREGEERKKVKLHPPPLPPAPGAKVQREEEEGNGGWNGRATGAGPGRGSSAQLGTLPATPAQKDPTEVQALPLLWPHLTFGGCWSQAPKTAPGLRDTRALPNWQW